MSAEGFPMFSFPAGYKQAPSPILEENTCQLCGHPIKNYFWLQNDARRWLLGVGSECVTHFAEGKSGKELAQDAQWESNREALRRVWGSYFALVGLFGVTPEDALFRRAYHRTPFGFGWSDQDAISRKLVALTGIASGDLTMEKRHAIYEDSKSIINVAVLFWKLLQSGGLPLVPESVEAKGWRPLKAAENGAITRWINAYGAQVFALAGKSNEIVARLGG
jgi:hypothetical protein